MRKLSNSLKKLNSEKNLIVGWCKAEIFSELKKTLEEKEIPFVGYSIEERINPFLTMAKVKSIITVGLSYNKRVKMPTDNMPRGAISVGAIGTDYHIQLKEILEEICNKYLSTNENKIFVDTGPMVDRYIAYKSGLGFYGKSGNIINEKLGSMFFIGYIFTDAELDYYPSPVEKSCLNCNKCIAACPGKAIRNNGFNYKKCVSYLTQCKDELSQQQKNIMGIQLYGCDACQFACPYNKDFYIENSTEAFPLIEEILNLSNKEFKNRFGKTAAGWRGKKVIQRNAEIALENINKRND